MSKVPVTILTGFLGSGKTSLLNRALRDPRMRGTVVIVNEFGDIGLDHELIEASRDSIVLLENGCLCCSVRGDLVDTLVDLQQRRLQGQIPKFDHVVIETSGLAEPTPITEVLGTAPAVRSSYKLAGILTTVDATNGLQTLETHEQSLKQVALADRIALTKTDLTAPSEDLLERLNRLNDEAQVLDIRDADAGDLLHFADVRNQRGRWRIASRAAGERPVPRDGASGHAAPNHDSRIGRFTVLRDEPWDLHTLKLILEALATNAGTSLLRVKGLVNVVEFPERPAVLHGAQQLLHSLAWLECWPSNDRRTRIVFITFDRAASEIEELIEAVEQLSMRTRAARTRVSA